MLKALLFDMGGTLEDVFHRSEFNEGCGKKIQDYLAAQGIRIALSPAAMMEHIESRNREYRKWGLEKGIELSPFELWSQWLLDGLVSNQTRLKTVADNLANIWERNYYSRSLRQETMVMLEALKKQGVVMGIISNTSCLTQVREILHEYGIHDFFGCVYLSAVSGCRKPNTELFLAAAADLGVLPGECIYVGDTVSRDVRGARLAGYLASIRINSELTGISDAGFGTEGEEADYLVAKLSEIPEIVKGIRGSGDADRKEEKA
jgi:putative hydrolase of the HAD superfamily